MWPNRVVGEIKVSWKWIAAYGSDGDEVHGQAYLQVLLYVKEGVVGVYDPSYVAKEITQLHKLKGMGMVVKLLKKMKEKGYELMDDVFISGCGNDGSQCNEMHR
jgi:hypothetical protein